MSALRFKHCFLPLVAVRSYAHRTTVLKPDRELRLLQRRVAAARLGVSWSGRAIPPSQYEDLR